MLMNYDVVYCFNDLRIPSGNSVGKAVFMFFKILVYYLQCFICTGQFVSG